TEKVKFFPTPLKPLPLPSLGPSRAQDEVVGGSALDSPGYARFGFSAISYACLLLLGSSSARWTMIERWDLFNHHQHWTLNYQRPRL
ncbi:hypothetical protein PROFUN_17087, partial [Planoprotostelium fungivorum]